MATVKKKTAKSTKSKKKEVTNAFLIEKYMDYVLEHGAEPLTVYRFCKDNAIEETDFYNHFGSFENLKMGIWTAFHTNTLRVLKNTPGFEEYPNKEKMLSYFFTFFEILTANRSYVLFALDEHKSMLRKMNQLKKLRDELKAFAASLIEMSNDDKNYKISKNPVRLFSEGAWVQFLFLLKYWIQDNSPSFEKTDVAIEKSVKAIFDVFETTPLESIIDFGKFLVKEKFSTNR
ncbi:TetR family transcriptional regulator C-terminal domain-containing protein [Dokdonia sp. Hel_I_53]|uniref:TetR family transcriptional regulator C-terminal domain-containing protein n=1 Tax=Dokdonia sp. Hel_I_53 TaxID=1566287 RepID=UPI00119A1BB1|nr:TetR family transcriptional regulator C-terminal domain-containing protein [Dokdonia sp. Hel_I_53]TVZ50976.1 AcrR family transcriptional regulator [Dokdonia sp. Hel_I_53]